MGSITNSFTFELAEIAQRLMELSSAGGKTESVVQSRDRATFEVNERLIAHKAQQEYEERRKRAVSFEGDPDLFGEPAWDILLDLAVQRYNDRQVSVTSACIAADVPATTALRWLQMLIDKGLIERRECISDKRRAYVELTQVGWRKMAQHFDQSHNSEQDNVVSFKSVQQ